MICLNRLCIVVRESTSIEYACGLLCTDIVHNRIVCSLQYLCSRCTTWNNSMPRYDCHIIVCNSIVNPRLYCSGRSSRVWREAIDKIIRRVFFCIREPVNICNRIEIFSYIREYSISIAPVRKSIVI